MKLNSKILLVVFGQLFLTVAALAQSVEVAGLQPDRRPAGAPAIERFEPGEAWKSKATKGIGEPQNGIGFLKDQGAWYTPFDRPNLTGRYDIRGLYGNEKQ